MESWGGADAADSQDLDNELQVKAEHIKACLPDGTCEPRRNIAMAAESRQPT